MTEERQDVVVVEPSPVAPAPQNDITNIGGANADELLYMAEQAEKRVTALNKIIAACFKITTPNDWCMIGGSLYLQESGVTKIANLIGISFEIVPGFPVVSTNSQGYKTYTYRVRAYGKTTHVEGEGSRSMMEDFFRKTKDGFKQPEEIKERDVMIAALTNAKNNAIKAIIPGLKNVEIKTLEEAGFKVDSIKGYTFKEGSKGGAVKSDAASTGLVCAKCGKAVTQSVASFSQGKYGAIYCIDCQKTVGK